jgi:nesprin-1
MLQAEKSRLVTAIQACEAATASVSRPGSPMTDQETTYSEKELNVKAKLEDLIDQVRKDDCDRNLRKPGCRKCFQLQIFF